MIPDISTSNSPSKRIVIIGAGAAGLVAIKTLRSTPELEFARGEWEILCFERRHALGGIWEAHEYHLFRPLGPYNTEDPHNEMDHSQ